MHWSFTTLFTEISWCLSFHSMSRWRSKECLWFVLLNIHWEPVFQVLILLMRSGRDCSVWWKWSFDLLEHWLMHSIEVVRNLCQICLWAPLWRRTCTESSFLNCSRISRTSISAIIYCSHCISLLTLDHQKIVRWLRPLLELLLTFELSFEFKCWKLTFLCNISLHSWSSCHIEPLLMHALINQFNSFMFRVFL